MEDNKLIAADDVTLAYEGYVAAEHVGFTLDRGDYLCVVGENGSGKSTLLKAITGEIRIGGGKLTLAEELLKNGIGYLPQQSKIQRDFPATVREVVLSGCAARESVRQRQWNCFAWRNLRKNALVSCREVSVSGFFWHGQSVYRKPCSCWMNR